MLTPFKTSAPESPRIISVREPHLSLFSPSLICRYGAVVGAVGASNVSIVGGGVLDGAGWTFWRLRAMNPTPLKCSRPHLVEFERCHDVTLDHIELRNSPFWTSHFVYSNGIRITNCSVFAPPTQGNTDGFNPDSSSNVHIEDLLRPERR